VVGPRRATTRAVSPGSAGVGVGVVVQDPDPLGRVTGLGELLEPEPHGLGEGGGAGDTLHRPEGFLEEGGALVLAARVDRDDPGDRDPL